MSSHVTTDDLGLLHEANRQFIEAFRQGSWELLEPVLPPGFRYLDGATGELWDLPRYIADLRGNPPPTLVVDQISIHLDGAVAAVSARSSVRPGSYNRYVDSYERRAGVWACFHACVWPLQ